MEKRVINPTPWLQHFALNHAVEVKNGQRVLYLSGQTSTEADGSTRHAGDMVKQFGFAWSNLKDALAQADMGPANIVRLNIYTTEVDAFMANADRSRRSGRMTARKFAARYWAWGASTIRKSL